MVGTRLLCALADEHGLSTSDILAGTAITAEQLTDPDGDVAAVDEIRTVRNFLALVPEPVMLGVSIGLRFNVANLGLLGFAVLACPTLREVLATSMRFFSLTSLHVALKEREGPNTYRLTMDSSHLPADVRDFFLARDLAGAAAVVAPFLSATFARHIDRFRAEVSLDDDYFGSALKLLPVSDVTFSRPVTFVEFPIAMLDEPLPQADENTMRMCIAQVEELVARRRGRGGIAGDVRSLLAAHIADTPTIDTLAESLYMHPRTLQRRLSEAGTSWRTLNNEVRATLAVELLSRIGLSVEEVSDRLGYSETAAFTHAFTRWYGVPPSTYRLPAPGR